MASEITGAALRGHLRFHDPDRASDAIRCKRLPPVLPVPSSAQGGISKLRCVGGVDDFRACTGPRKSPGRRSHGIIKKSSEGIASRIVGTRNTDNDFAG